MPQVYSTPHLHEAPVINTPVKLSEFSKMKDQTSSHKKLRVLRNNRYIQSGKTSVPMSTFKVINYF